MTAGSHVGRLHLRCRAGRPDETRALRLRGRLETTARVHLPEALERALGGAGRRVLADRVTVLLDFDPGDYDDVTVAALWAARVARALADEGATSDVRVFDSERDLYVAAAREWADTGGLTWHFEELGCGTGARVPGPEVLAAFDTRERVAALAAELTARPGRLERVRARLTASQRGLVLAALAGRRRWADWLSAGSAGVPEREAGRSSPPALHPGSPVPPQSVARGAQADAARAATGRGAGGASAARDEWRAAWRRCAATEAAGIHFHMPGRPPVEATASAADGPAGTRPLDGAEDSAHPAAAEAGVETPRRRPGPERDTSGDPAAEGTAWRTDVAGLVLLYPWLEAYLEREDDVGARIWALAALASDDPEPLARDPLLRALAGDDPALAPGGCPVPPPEPELLRPPAEAVLARFAAALPGFESSTPAYLRREFLVRGGRLEPLEEGLFAVVLEPRPLDLVLDRLAYPPAPFALPWSPTFVPSIEGRDA